MSFHNKRKEKGKQEPKGTLGAEEEKVKIKRMLCLLREYQKVSVKGMSNNFSDVDAIFCGTGDMAL